MAADAFIQLDPDSNWPYGTQRPGDTSIGAIVWTSLTGAVGSYVPCPDGTVVTFSILSGPGALTNVTTTVGGTARANLTNGGTGTTVVRASVSITVGGTPLTRTTGDGLSTDGPDMTKIWVYAQARITFTGRSGQTQVGVPGQTFPMQATIEVDSGSGFTIGPAGSVIIMGLFGGLGSVGSFVGGIATCTTGDNTARPPNTGSCAASSVATGGVTSNIAGTNQIGANSLVIVNGATLRPKINDGFQTDGGYAHVIWGAAPILHVRWSTGGYPSNG